MTQEPLPYPKTPTYIGRTAQVQFLIEQITALHQPTTPPQACRVLTIEAAGGLGKTRLLESLPDLVRDQAASVRIVRIIDFDEYARRSPRGIEAILIDGLIQRRGPEQHWYRLPPHVVEHAFEHYHQQLKEYTASRMQTRPRLTETDLLDAFITDWNTLAAQYPLVIRFDTVERLFRTVRLPDALTNQPEASSGADLVLEWLRYVLPRLTRTLVIFSGRPLALTEPSTHPLTQLLTTLYTDQDQPLLLPEGQLQLEAFQPHSPDIPMYIQQYVRERTTDPAYQAEDRYEPTYVYQLTQGFPLFLSVFAETYFQPMPADGGFPQPPTALKDKKDFETYIIEQILTTYSYRHHPEATTTLLRCLYILAYARRGLRAEQLRAAFQAVGYPDTYLDTVIQALPQVALVKTRPILSYDAETPEQLPSTDDAVVTVLLLHDEITRLIDEGGFAREQGIDKDLLSFLIAQSREQVQQIRQRTQQPDPTQLLQAMANHIYYTLSGNVRDAYRLYTVYMDDLLDNERQVDAAFVLSDAFWESAILFAERAGQSLEDYLSSEPGLKYAEIVRDEQVRRVKVLLARGDTAAAATLGETLLQHYAAAMQHDPYFAIELQLFTAIAEIKAKSFGREDRIVAVVKALEPQVVPAPEPDADLLVLRCPYLLGLAHTTLSSLRYQQQEYERGIEADKAARKWFEVYRPIAEQIDDEVVDLIAQASNNYAYNLLMTGDIQSALQVSDKVLRQYAGQLSAYRAALAYNVNGLIQRTLSNWIESDKALQQAAEFAERAQVRRAQGMVAMAQAQLRREEQSAKGIIDPTINDTFQQAVTLLENEPDQLREVYFQWSGFLRELAIYAKQRGDQVHAQHYRQHSLAYLDQALNLVGEQPSMQRAEFLKSKAIIHNLLGEYEYSPPLLADAEAILRAIQAPRYVHVICGKIAFQRGVLALKQAQDYDRALILFAIGLARQYVYAPLHRDQINFEKRITQYITGSIPNPKRRTFDSTDDVFQIPRDALAQTRDTLAETVTAIPIGTSELAYQPPDPTEWDKACIQSVRFIERTIEIELDV